MTLKYINRADAIYSTFFTRDGSYKTTILPVISMHRLYTTKHSMALQGNPLQGIIMTISFANMKTLVRRSNRKELSSWLFKAVTLDLFTSSIKTVSILTIQCKWLSYISHLLLTLPPMMGLDTPFGLYPLGSQLKYKGYLNRWRECIQLMVTIGQPVHISWPTTLDTSVYYKASQQMNRMTTTIS